MRCVEVRFNFRWHLSLDLDSTNRVTSSSNRNRFLNARGALLKLMLSADNFFSEMS